MIRFANTTDIDDIMQFIDTHWKKGHILGNNKDFFNYEHKLNEEVTYVIYRNDETNEIEATLGYIPYAKTNRDVMLVMWKSIHQTNPTLGLELIMYLIDKGDVRIVASPGINKKTRGIYRYLNYDVGTMTQWYRLRKGAEFKIAKIENDDIPKVNKQTCLYKQYKTWDDFIEDFDFEKYYASNPKTLKEKWYIKKRYFDHPTYKYEIFGHLDNDGIAETIYIFRKVEVEDSCVLRFIDCIGNYENISLLNNLVDDLLEKYNAEYSDLYECGLNEQLLETSGWKKTVETDNIIPNYFSPFEQKNVEIYYCSSDSDIVLFKGDGDQDRPN